MLNSDGHVAEGSGENVFLVAGGLLYTPPSQDNILVGITRATIIELAERELGLRTVERSIDRSELYMADELFMTGTAAHVTPVLEVDNRKVGEGGIGPVSAKLQRFFFDAIRGRLEPYRHWLTPVYRESLIQT